MFLSLHHRVAAVGGFVSPHFSVRPGLHFSDIGVEHDGTEFFCIIWCVVFHSTRVHADC